MIHKLPGIIAEAASNKTFVDESDRKGKDNV